MLTKMLQQARSDDAARQLMNRSQPNAMLMIVPNKMPIYLVSARDHLGWRERAHLHSLAEHHAHDGFATSLWIVRHSPADRSVILPTSLGIGIEEVWQGWFTHEEVGHEGEEETGEETVHDGRVHAFRGRCRYDQHESSPWGDDMDSLVAVSAVISPSIHCSSSARACSSSPGTVN